MHLIKKIQFLTVAVSLAILGALGCAGDEQFLLDAEGTMTVTDLGPAQIKAQTQEQQAPIEGTVVVRMTEDFPDAIDIEIVSMNLTSDFGDGLVIQLQVTPIIEDSVLNRGILFKRQDGNPLGTSTIDIDTTALLPNGETILLGGLNFQAEVNDPNRLPLLSNIPVINFLFRDRAKEAQVDNLILMVTPELADVLEE